MVKTVFTRHYLVLSLLLTVVWALGIFMLIRDPWSRMGHAVDRLTSTLHDRETFESRVQYAVQRTTLKDASMLHVQGTLALHALDYPTAAILFERLHHLMPEETDYYLGYAQALLHTTPDNPMLSTLIQALQRQPEPDLERWLLFAQYEQLVGHNDTAMAYYEKARALASPGSALESAIQAQQEIIKP